VVKEKREAKTSLGKRSRKELKKQFLELEADEGEEEEDSGVKKQVKEAELKQQYYKEDELRPSANRLDNAFIKKLEIRAKKEEQDVKLETKQDPSDLEASEAMEVDEVERDVTLPSNMDSKLWRLKVKPGMERQLVMRLTNKLISRLNEG
jgi:transcription elongation factor SPT5